MKHTHKPTLYKDVHRDRHWCCISVGAAFHSMSPPSPIVPPYTQSFVWSSFGELPKNRPKKGSHPFLLSSVGVSALLPFPFSPLFSFGLCVKLNLTFRMICPIALTDHGRAPSKSGLCTLTEVIHGCGSTVRHLEVGVDVNATGDHHLPICLDGLHPTGHDQVVADLPVKCR